ncbi:zinc finger protein 8-like, partial [Trifolium medium]|nr:zinc finger protein 8-like [Trifolium medium]
MSHIANQSAKGKAPMIEESQSNVETQSKRKSIVVEESVDAIQKKRYKCIYCEKSFDTPQGLGGHYRSHKNERNVKPRATPSSRGKERFSTEKCKVVMANIDAWFKANRTNYPQVKEADQK